MGASQTADASQKVSDCMIQAANAGQIRQLCSAISGATQNPLVSGACASIVQAGAQSGTASDAIKQALQAEIARRKLAEKNAEDERAFLQKADQVERLVKQVEKAAGEAKQKCQQLDRLAAQARAMGAGAIPVACGPAAAAAARAKTEGANKLLNEIRQSGATLNQLLQQANGREASTNVEGFGAQTASPAIDLAGSYVDGWRARLKLASQGVCPAAQIATAAKEAEAAAAAALKIQQQVKDLCPQPPAPPAQQQAANQPPAPPSANKTPESRNCYDYCMSGAYSPAKGDAAFSSSGPLTGDVNACLQPAPLCDCPRIDRKLAGTEQQCQAAIDKVFNDKNSKVTSLGPPPAAAPSAGNAAPPKPPAAPSGLPAGTPVEAGGVSAGLPPAGKPPRGGDEQKPIEIASISTVGEEQGHTPEPPPEKPIASVATTGEEQGHTAAEPANPPVAQTPPPAAGHIPAANATPERPVEGPRAAEKPANPSAPSQPATTAPVEKPAATAPAGHPPETAALVDKPPGQPPAAHPATTAPLVDKPASAAPAAHPAQSAAVVDKPAAVQPGAGHPAETPALVDKPAGQPPSAHPATTAPLVDKPAATTTGTQSEADKQEAEKRKQEAAAEEKRKQEAAAAEEKRKQEAAAAEKRKQEEEKQHKQAMLVDKPDQSIGQPAPPGPPLPVCKVGNLDFQNGQKVSNTLEVGANRSCTNKGFKPAGGSTTVVAAAKNGLATAQGDHYTYKPNPNFKGADSFTVQRQWEEKGHASSATITYNVTVIEAPRQQAPVALAPPLPVCKVGNVDFQNGQKVSNTLEVGVNQSCTNKGYKPVGGSTTVVAAAKNGLATAQGDHYTYKPSPNFRGADSFTVQRQWAENGHASNATITYNVTVVDAPLAVAPPAHQANAARPQTPPTPEFHLSGTWNANDNGTYVITQNEQTVTWEGKSSDNGQTWSHTFTGTMRANVIEGFFRDHPPGRFRNEGPLSIRIVDQNRLEKVPGTGGNFGGSVWSRQNPPK